MGLALAVLLALGTLLAAPNQSHSDGNYGSDDARAAQVKLIMDHFKIPFDSAGHYVGLDHECQELREIAAVPPSDAAGLRQAVYCNLAQAVLNAAIASSRAHPVQPVRSTVTPEISAAQVRTFAKTAKTQIGRAKHFARQLANTELIALVARLESHVNLDLEAAGELVQNE
jgi:hypothetical protein